MAATLCGDRERYGLGEGGRRGAGGLAEDTRLRRHHRQPPNRTLTLETLQLVHSESVRRKKAAARGSAAQHVAAGIGRRWQGGRGRLTNGRARAQAPLYCRHRITRSMHSSEKQQHT